MRFTVAYVYIINKIIYLISFQFSTIFCLDISVNEAFTGQIQYVCCRFLCTVYLSHLFDFGASFANEGATLAGRDNEPQGYRGFTGGWTVAHGVDNILRKRKNRLVLCYVVIY